MARYVEISDATHHRVPVDTRAQFGGMKPDDAKWPKELEAENARSSGSSPTRSWRSTRCGRSRRDTGEPVATASGWDHPARTAQFVAATGV